MDQIEKALQAVEIEEVKVSIHILKGLGYTVFEVSPTPTFFKLEILLEVKEIYYPNCFLMVPKGIRFLI